MKILKKCVGQDPVEIEISDTKWRGEIAKRVIGEENYYEPVTLISRPTEDTALQMVCDEDGLNKELETNFYLEFPHHPNKVQKIVGDVGFLRIKKLDSLETYDYEVVEITPEDIETINELFDKNRQEILKKVYEEKYNNNGFFFSFF